MMELEAPEAIVSNAKYHTHLLSLISELEYIPSAKKHHTSYVKDLEAQLEQSKRKVANLALKTKKERKEHADLRDSTARRFAHKLVGKREKYEALESKEEREYVEALENEMTERDNQNVIQQLLKDAKDELGVLIEKEKQYHSAQVELHALYGRVFDGPTEAFPEDDRLEYELNDTIRRHEEAQAMVNADSQAAELLARAARSMDLCQQNMSEALSYSRYDMWGGGSLTDMMERSALRNAQAQAYQVETLVTQAMRASPRVQHVGQINIAQGSVISDVFFDNVFSDIAFHNKIKQSTAQVLRANERLKAERDAARRRADAAGVQLIRAAGELDQRRQELDQFRRATFESYLAHHPPPPDYETVVTKEVPLGFSSRPALVDTPATSGGTSPAQTPLTSTSPMHLTSPNSSAERPVNWGRRNPYAAAMAERTRSMSK